MDYEKAKRALDVLSQERQAQQNRLQLTAQAKQRLDNNNASRFLSGVEGRTQSLYKR